MEQENEQPESALIQDDSPTDEQLTIVSSRETKAVVERLNALAETRGLSRSKLVSQMLHAALNQTESLGIHEQVCCTNEASSKSLIEIQAGIKLICDQLRVIQNKSPVDQGITPAVIGQRIEQSLAEMNGQFLAALSDELGGAWALNHKYLAATILGTIFASLIAVCFLFGAFPGELRNLPTEIKTLRTINAIGK